MVSQYNIDLATTQDVSLPEISPAYLESLNF